MPAINQKKLDDSQPSERLPQKFQQISSDAKSSKQEDKFFPLAGITSRMKVTEH
ncbi:MAG: hypothetical protein LBH98_06005 [Chitinispirillales bacterium]|jgi:hypothetical protein|nr:hypothetical protein [Chitinispirillales bacterium]